MCSISTIRCQYNGHVGHTNIQNGSVEFYGIKFPRISAAITMLKKMLTDDEYYSVKFSRGSAMGIVRKSDGMVLVSMAPYIGSKLFSSIEKAERQFGQHFF